MARFGPEHVAAVGACFLSGAIMSIFLVTIPVLIETAKQPAKLVSSWRAVFVSGHVKGPGIAAATGLVYACAAWRKSVAGEPWWVFAVAGLTTVGMVPYTWVFMQRTNNALFHADDMAAKGQEPALEDAERLVTWWARLNVVRALFPLAGGVLGLLGACGVLVF